MSSSCPPSSYPPNFLPDRVRTLTSNPPLPNTKTGKCIIYFMHRDQRVEDNHALNYAQHLANIHDVKLVVTFPFFTSFGHMSIRQYRFMVDGLKEVEAELNILNIPFHVFPTSELYVDFIKLANRLKPVAVVQDYSPLNQCVAWSAAINDDLHEAKVPLYQVDAANIVPVWSASDKQESGARTIRPKLNGLLSKYLKPFDVIVKQKKTEDFKAKTAIDWNDLLTKLDAKVDLTVPQLPPNLHPAGKTAGLHRFDNWLSSGIKKYSDLRNNPNEEVCSGMSVYLRFGQVCFQTLALRLRDSNDSSGGKSTFMEEGFVRRELADNYCHYNSNYDNVNGGAKWSLDSLELHSNNARSVVYTLEQLDQGLTHDDLWNAAQIQMRTTGKMAGFCRMYWAKKLIEWSPSHVSALAYAQELNDKYSIDGTCPNGYAGINWSILGVHDMGFAERLVFGKVRYMNYAGCLKKFDVQEFVDSFVPAGSNAALMGGEKTKVKKGEKDVYSEAVGLIGKAGSSRSSSSSSSGSNKKAKK